MKTLETHYPNTRLRRLRQQPNLRDLVTETRLSVKDFILPLFIKATITEKKPIAAMPGQFQLAFADLAAEVEEIVRLKIPGVILFGLPAYKDATGSAAAQAGGVIQQAIAIIKEKAPHLLVITDLCFCEYTDHGHCGVLTQQANEWTVDNDATLPLLIEQAISHVQAGADVIAPSGMMDGVVTSLRQGLDEAGYAHIPILSYAVKYASSLYGPFREAAESGAQIGDRKSYQMNPANNKEALREAALDIQEGADMLMVKPAGAYLDVIYRLKQAYPEIPLSAYQVSGEYAMIKAAGANGWINEQAVALESLLAIKRAGADFILTYFAKDAAEWLKNDA